MRTSYNWIQTYLGRQVWPTDWDAAELFEIEDIAHALSQQCRFNGHTKGFYSVAEHSCLVASLVMEAGGTPLDCLQALLHDAAEAYLCDIPSPLKHLPEFEFYRTLEHHLQTRIYRQFEVPEIVSDVVKAMDRRALEHEAYALMRPYHPAWACRLPLDVPPCDIIQYTPAQAEIEFLFYFQNLREMIRKGQTFPAVQTRI